MTQTASAVLLQQRASLVEHFTQLATRLTLAATALQDSGLPPPASLIEELIASRQDFADLCTRVLSLAQSLGMTALPALESLASLGDLKSLLWTVAQAEEQRAVVENLHKQACLVLDRVLALVHREQSAFSPLLECQTKASELRLAVAEVSLPHAHPAAEALAEGRHPFADLLALVEEQAELDDDRWVLLQDTVEQEFGKPLAVAASRGKLVLSVHSLPEQCLLPARAAAQEVRAQADLAGSSVSWEAEDGRRQASGQLIAVLPPAALEVESSGAEQEPCVSGSGLDNPSLPVAVSIANGNGANEERSSTLRDMVWRLIFEDKTDLAFHVARYVEGQYPDYRPCVPSWLLRSVVLGRHVRHANGEIAHFLQEDFARFSAACFTAEAEEWNDGVRFLLVAAVLQPALLAPATGASAVLRAIQFSEHLPQLSQICHLVADYSDAGQPLDPQVLRKGKDQTAWQADMDFLKQAVEAWGVRALHVAMVHPPATKVWSKWQEPKGVLHTLLSPMRQNDLSKLAVVKRAIEQLADDTQIKREVDRTDREVLGRRLGEDITGKALDQLRRHAREAVGLARRWVELQETRASQRTSSTHERAEQLRQEVWTRQGAILEELNTFKRRHPSMLIVSSVGCCRRALENVITLFDPEASFPTEEPLPRPLLHADLLRIPALSLNDQWEVEDADQEALVDGILKLVANGPSQRAAL